MKIQFNKEFVLKHRFWIMLGLVVPITLVGVVLLGAAAGQIAKQRAAINEDIKTVEKAGSGGDVQNEETIALLSKKGAEIGNTKFVVWGKAYKEQEPNFIWPKELEEKYHFASGKFALEVAVDMTPFDYKSLPDDADGLLHGRVNYVNGKDSIDVLDRKNKVHTIYNTPQAKVEVGGDSKDKFWNHIAPGSYVKVKYQVGRYFGDPLTLSEQTLYMKVYKSQIPPLLEQLMPVDEKGKGVVQFPGYVYSKYNPYPPANSSFFYYVVGANGLPGDWNDKQDNSEEAWLAQEDLWIQREIFRLVRLANDYVSVFKGQGGEVKDKEYTFTNPYWNLTVKWSGGNKLIVKLDNLLNRRQKLDGLKLWVRTNKNKVFDPEVVEVMGEPLAPRGFDNSSITQVITLPPGGNRTGIYKVEQILDWESAAIRRIDQVAFGGVGGMALCHRLASLPLLPFKAEDPATASGGAGGAPPAGGAGGAPPAAAAGPEPGKGLGMMGMMGNQVKPALPNKLVKERYIEVQQGKFRRLPVAVCMIVEQDHVDRVQAAFNNSVFRFMTTQVIINRYGGTLRPQVITELASGVPGEFDPKGPRPMDPGVFPGGIDPKGKFPGAFEPKGKFPMPVPMPNPMFDPKGKLPMAEFPMPGGEGGVKTQGAGEDLETNVELIIYGIITLYEQPRASTAAAADTKAPAVPDKK